MKDEIHILNINRLQKPPSFTKLVYYKFFIFYYKLQKIYTMEAVLFLVSVLFTLCFKVKNQFTFPESGENIDGIRYILVSTLEHGPS